MLGASEDPYEGPTEKPVGETRLERGLEVVDREVRSGHTTHQRTCHGTIALDGVLARQVVFLPDLDGQNVANADPVGRRGREAAGGGAWTDNATSTTDDRIMVPSIVAQSGPTSGLRGRGPNRAPQRPARAASGSRLMHGGRIGEAKYPP